MDNIINTIKEYRKKIIETDQEIDVGIRHRLEGYLEEAEYYMRLARRTVNEHNIEL